ncbi:MAG: DUF4116 domain-containing protein [Candidatus Pacearchaeota archaeon]|jgi:hypothetical protein
MKYITQHADKETALAAVKQDGWALQFASGELKNDKDFFFDLINFVKTYSIEKEIKND